MANTWTEVVPKLLAQGLMALREQIVLPRLVNRAYEALADRKGTTIDVPIPSAITATAVSPSNTPPTNVDSAPTSVPIPLNQWYEAPFHLTDKEELEVMQGVIPIQASEAVKALANKVETHLFGFYTGVYGFAGTPGTTPFASDLTAFTAARKTLHEQLAPFDPRVCVIDPDAEANALNLRAFQDASYRGDTAGIVAGQIGQKLGSMWVMSQHVPTHTAGTGASYVVNKAEGYAPGATTIEVDGGSGTMLVGDIVTFAGHDQPYVVTAALASDQFRIAPGLQAAVADDAAVTLKATHVVNLVFHRDAIAFATRPLEGTVRPGLGSVVETAVDPVSGLALRLEVTRQHKQTNYAFDILWGAALVRPELAVRLAG